MTITLHQVQAALTLAAFDADAAHNRMTPAQRRLFVRPDSPPRLAGVLILLYQEADELRMVLTRRREDLRDHSGQISFPGGRRDPSDASFAATALREVCEELALCEADIEIIGALTPFYIPPSNYEVHPLVGYLPSPPTLHPNPEEVAEVLRIPLDWLVDDSLKRSEPWTFAGGTFDVPYYLFDGHKVWGATASMLSELEARIRSTWTA